MDKSLAGRVFLSVQSDDELWKDISILKEKAKKQAQAQAVFYPGLRAVCCGRRSLQRKVRPVNCLACFCHMAVEEDQLDVPGKEGACSGLILSDLSTVLPGIAMYCADWAACTSTLVSLRFAGL